MSIEQNTPAQAAQLWEMKRRACRAHALCNELRLAHPEIPELGDDGVLHEAIHDILRVDTPTAAPVGMPDVFTAMAAAVRPIAQAITSAVPRPFRGNIWELEGAITIGECRAFIEAVYALAAAASPGAKP